jgi:hypothetical protein
MRHEVRRGSRLAVALAVAFGGCASPPQASAPAATPSAAPSDDPQVNALVASACYECHSNEGSAPWYGALAPSYWFAIPARKVLNFSEWSSYDAARREAALQAIAKTVESGEMPPWDYTLLDGSASLSDAQKEAMVRWAESAARPPTPGSPTPGSLTPGSLSPDAR